MLLFLMIVLAVPAHAEPITDTLDRFTASMEGNWVKAISVIFLIVGFLSAAVDKGPHKYDIAVACICVACALNVRAFMDYFL